MDTYRVTRKRADGTVVVTKFQERPLLRRLVEQRGLEHEIRDQRRVLDQLTRRGN